MEANDELATLVDSFRRYPSSEARRKETTLPKIICTDEQRAINRVVSRAVPLRNIHQSGVDKRQTPYLGER